MKPIRFATLILTLILLVTAFIPLAPKAAATQTQTYTNIAPTQTILDAMLGRHLFAPLSVIAPVITLRVENLASRDYACTLVAQTPKDWVTMQRRQSFDAVWNLQNTGTKNWGKTGIDYAYVSGAKMHTGANRFDLPNDVGPYGKIKIRVDMESPKTKGYFTTVWGLLNSSGAFCRVTLSINVNR
jgi:hypothetical protein